MPKKIGGSYKRCWKGTYNLIRVPSLLKPSGPDSELGAGAYLTDYFALPDNGGPVSLSIATILGIPAPFAPDANRITAYLDLRINWNIYGPFFDVKNIRGANQYCFRNKELIIDNHNVILLSPK